MPSTSAKQHRFMEAAANSAKFAKEAGIPQSVAREYVAADKQTQHPPRHQTSHDQPTKCPPRQHGTCDMPTRPGAGRAGG